MECGFNIEMFPFADNKLAYTTMTILHTILNNNKLFFCNPLSVENPKKLNNKQTKNQKKKKKQQQKQNKTRINFYHVLSFKNVLVFPQKKVIQEFYINGCLRNF